jgi:2-oxoisovalerate dehydrogenase E1 component beta subunit
MSGDGDTSVRDEAEARGAERSPEVPQASPSEAAQQAGQAEGKPDRAAQEERRGRAEKDESEAGAAGHGAEPRGKRTEDGQATYLVAIAEALWEEMERDERVFVLGEDVGVYGGAFKVTEGFIDRFGPERVMDTPIAEETIVGTAVGAAMEGMRPVAEFQYADFMTSGFDELVTVAGKYHWRSGVRLPCVFRGPSGGGVRASNFHSNNPEPFFAYTPGLKVVCPAFPTDAKGLLKSAIRDDDPVVYLEHKWIYRRIREHVPEDPDFLLPIGKAEVKRQGDDVSVIAYGAMVHKALEAAEDLADDGVSVEVLDLRTVWPMDVDAILRTVERTSRAVVLYESHKAFGIGAEVSAVIAEDGFDLLDAPVVRIAPPNVPVPFSPPLEDAYLPQVDDIVDAIQKLSKW